MNEKRYEFTFHYASIKTDMEIRYAMIPGHLHFIMLLLKLRDSKTEW